MDRGQAKVGDRSIPWSDVNAGGQVQGVGEFPSPAPGQPLAEKEGTRRIGPGDGNPLINDAERQRQRIFAGTARALAEQGSALVTVEHIVGAAGVSRSTFYKRFGNRRDCLIQAHEDVFRRLADHLLHACAGESGWPEKVAAGLRAALDFAAQQPQEAHLLIVDAVAVDAAVAARVIESNDCLAALLRSGREQSERAAELPDLTESALVGAASGLIGSRLLSGRSADLGELTPALIQLFLIPYVSREDAQRLACEYG